MCGYGDNKNMIATLKYFHVNNLWIHKFQGTLPLTDVCTWHFSSFSDIKWPCARFQVFTLVMIQVKVFCIVMLS